jgi:hypothetical protein
MSAKPVLNGPQSVSGCSKLVIINAVPEADWVVYTTDFHTVDMHSQHGGQSRDDDVDDMCVRWLVVGRVVVIGQSRIVSLGDLSPLISRGSSPRRPAAVYRQATDVHPSFDMSTRCVIDRSGSSDTILWRDTTMIVSLWLSI